MIKESQDSALKLHCCPICGLTYLIPEEQTHINCYCGTIIDISPELLLEELIYDKNKEIIIEGAYETPEKTPFTFDYCNIDNL